MSHIALTYHLVFATKYRRPTIVFDHERELWKFMFDMLNKRGAYVRRIGGMPDHVHILCDLKATDNVAGTVQLLKIESSKFMRVNPHFPNWEGWSEGYGAFTVDASLREIRRSYIMKQREHHQCVNFIDEYRNLLIANEFVIDEKILGDEAG